MEKSTWHQILATSRSSKILESIDAQSRTNETLGTNQTREVSGKKH